MNAVERIREAFNHPKHHPAGSLGGVPLNAVTDLRMPREMYEQAVADLATIEQALKEAREALWFYGDVETYTQTTSWGERIVDDEGPWISDTGKRARQALAKLAALEGEAE